MGVRRVDNDIFSGNACSFSGKLSEFPGCDRVKSTECTADQECTVLIRTDQNRHGGEIVAEGTPEDIKRLERSYTGKYL
jgi:hypothetical protein